STSLYYAGLNNVLYPNVLLKDRAPHTRLPTGCLAKNLCNWIQ
ncbi:7179_t:CDS:1, partial [Funneliformis caledonium]